MTRKRKKGKDFVEEDERKISSSKNNYNEEPETEDIEKCEGCSIYFYMYELDNNGLCNNCGEI